MSRVLGPPGDRGHEPARETRTAKLKSRVAAQLRVPFVRNAYSLVSSTFLTAVLGFVFWVVAARQFPKAVVGRDASLVSAMILVSALAQLNLGMGFNRFVPTAGHGLRRFVRAGYLTAVVAALAASGAYVLGINVWTPRLSVLVSPPSHAVWFVVATMIWTIFTLEDGVLIGLGESHWVLVENSAFGVLKVIALVVIATQVNSFGIFLAWTFPVLLVVVPVNLFLFRRAIPARSHEPPSEHLDVAIVARFVTPDFVAGLLRTATTSLMPIMVLAIVNPAASADAYIAWNIAFTLFLLANNVGAALITEAARAPERVAEYTRKALSHCFAIIVPVALVTVVGAHLVLRLFGAAYQEHATTLLRLIALSAIPNVVVATYVNVARVQRRMTAVFVTIAASSASLLILSAVLLEVMGLDGLGIAWLATYLVTAAVIMLGDFRFVWRPARGTPARS